MKSLVVSSGSINKYDKLIECFKESDYILCADGGLDHLARLNLLPHLVVGDLDSISPKGKKYMEEKKIELIKYPSVSASFQCY